MPRPPPLVAGASYTNRKGVSMAPDQTMPETKTQEAELLGILTERNITQREGGQA